MASPADMPTQTMDFVVTGTSFRSMVGETVSHYRVLSCLGSGGMVYEAEDVKLCRRVAMKFLSAILHMKEYLELVPRVRRCAGVKGRHYYLERQVERIFSRGGKGASRHLN